MDSVVSGVGFRKQGVMCMLKSKCLLKGYRKVAVDNCDNDFLWEKVFEKEFDVKPEHGGKMLETIFTEYQLDRITFQDIEVLE